jgi:osmotically-inducible protein OsmY
VVTLVGTVDTAAERNLAVQVAQDIQGVAKVDASGIKTS